MSIFGNLTTEAHEEVADRLGGFALFPTDIYEAKIKMAYAGASQKGARFVHLIADIGGKEYSETIYVTNKDGQNFYHPKDANGKPDTSKKNTMPGYVTVDDICLLTTGKPLNEQDSEEKIVKIFDYESKKEVPTSVPVLVELLGTDIRLAIQQSKEDKNKQNESTGLYEPTGETRDTNNIEKAFHFDTKMTVVEIRQEAKEATFHDAWGTKNRGVVRDKTTGAKAGGNNGRPPQSNGTAPAGGAAKPGLFAKKS
jgi:hypothetical protein